VTSTPSLDGTYQAGISFRHVAQFGGQTTPVSSRQAQISKKFDKNARRRKNHNRAIRELPKLPKLATIIIVRH
jgi:hypothetical protein